MATPVRKPLICIVGVTASGKSALAMEAARRHNGEIIAADSRTIYRGMDIGTAKPSKADQTEVEHHLLDVVYPGERFTAADFKKLANEAINDISNSGKLPIIVGGTGLYIDSILFDYKFAKDIDPQKRKELNAKTDVELARLVNNRGGEHIDTHNRRHMIRFLETGGTPKQAKKLRKDTLVVGIDRKKSEIRNRIEKRTEAMFRKGLRKEVDKLVKKYGWNNEAMTSVIYKLFKEYQAGEISMSELKRKNVLRELQLVKRQKTWLKRNPYIQWFSGENDLLEAVNDYLVD